VGAEEGDMPALYASWGCEVALIEPNPRVWPNIKTIWDANSLSPPVNWHVGFAGPTGEAQYRWDEAHVRPVKDGWPACAYGPVIGDHGFLNLCERGSEVSTIALDEWTSHTPTAVTIDVEGAELEVLRGAMKLLQRARPLVWVSIHPIFMREMYGQDARTLHRLMRGCEYEGHLLAASHEEHWLFLPR
jgi:FkbM family methyltransferase